MANLEDLIGDMDRASADFRKLRNDLPRLGGIKMVQAFRRNMDKEGFIENGRLERWPARTPGTPRDRGRKLLRDRGTLYDSIRVTRQDGDSVSVGVDLTKVPYAQLQNEGGAVRLTPKMRKFFWAQFFRTKDDFWKRLALSRRPFLKVPKRKFMGLTVDIDVAVEREIVTRLDGVFS